MKTTQENRRNLPNGGDVSYVDKNTRASNRGHFDDLVDDMHDDKMKDSTCIALFKIHFFFFIVSALQKIVML